MRQGTPRLGLESHGRRTRAQPPAHYGLLPQRRVDPQGQERVVGVVVEVHRGNAAGQDVQNTHCHQPVVQPVLLVEGAKAARGSRWRGLSLETWEGDCQGPWSLSSPPPISFQQERKLAVSPPSLFPFLLFLQPHQQPSSALLEEIPTPQAQTHHLCYSQPVFKWASWKLSFAGKGNKI